MKTKQAVNPYLPSWEYVPDAEPHIVDGRVYIYGSHDLFNGLNFCLGDYVCWSAPVDDLGNWRYEGVIFKREQDPAAPKIRLTNGLAAPDMIQGSDGRFYLYYFMGGTKMISVAVCDKPAGKYEFYGYVKYADGTPIGKKEEPLQFDQAFLWMTMENCIFTQALPFREILFCLMAPSLLQARCNVLRAGPRRYAYCKNGTEIHWNCQ